jgi:adenylate cyclase
MISTVLDELRKFLRAAGAPDDDIARAEAEGWLPLLALDSRLTPGEQKYDVDGLARELGVDGLLVRRLWRSLGFPDVPDGLAVFSDEDLSTARRLLGQDGGQRLDLPAILRMVRVHSASMSRIAATEAESIAGLIHELRDAGASDDRIALELAQGVPWDDIAALLDYSHRIQLRAALWRRLTFDAEPDIAVAVGFVDLSGYTELSSSLGAEELSDLVGRWEEVAFDTAAACGSRVVKTIGDEVMFVGLPMQAAHTALRLRDAAARDPMLMSARGGVAAGPVVVRDGDYYGPVVNLASRLTQVAARGMILAPVPLCEDLQPGVVQCEPEGLRSLRGIGDVPTCRLEWASGHVP